MKKARKVAQHEHHGKHSLSNEAATKTEAAIVATNQKITGQTLGMG